jgi:Fe-S cluster biosynthesis and repair protein YggX
MLIWRLFFSRFFLEFAMTRMVTCVVLKREAPGLDRVPYPGALGERIFNSVSAEGWQQWIEQQTMIINENGLSTMDPNSLELLEKHMLSFLFGEGELANQPFRPPSAKK